MMTQNIRDFCGLDRTRAWFAPAACAAIPIVSLLAASPVLAETGAITELGAYANAICNDGTPGAYYKSTVAGSTTWVFFLEGGFECHTDADCETRWVKTPLRTTSAKWQVTKTQGLLSPNCSTNPAFCGANKVMVHYCSSDYWSGAKTPTVSPPAKDTASTSWPFQGRAIAVAALMDLVKNDTAFKKATSVVFSGSSAGGVGISVTLNDLIPHLPPSATNNLLVVDAGFTLEIYGFAPNNPPTYMTNVYNGDVQLTDGLMFWNGRGDVNCAATMAGQSYPYNCYNTAKLFQAGFTSLPAFISEGELDPVQLNIDGFTGTINKDQAHMTYATEFADAMKQALQASGALSSVFAPQRQVHQLLNQDGQITNPESFDSGLIEPTTALNSWASNPQTRTQLYGNADGLP